MNIDKYFNLIYFKWCFPSDVSSVQARRENISERMKILQDLVPGCNKVSINHHFDIIISSRDVYLFSLKNKC